MNRRLLVLAIPAILIAAIGASPAFGQFSEPITVTTDKASYTNGEKILVEGHVLQLFNQPVAVQIIDPLGSIVAIDQASVSANKTFSSEFTAGGALKRNGEYTVKVIYVNESKFATATFEIGGIVDTPSDDTSFDLDGIGIGYTIVGGKLISITPNEESKALIIEIETTSDGTLIIDFPRSIIDAKLGDDGCSGEDGDFFILIDGQEREFDELISEESRKLTINFTDGSEEIEIIGTCVIPEFGTIAVLVLAVAIVSIIAVSARSRLGIMPKY